MMLVERKELETKCTELDSKASIVFRNGNPNATNVLVDGISINEGAKAEKHQQKPKQAGLGVILIFTSITCITGCRS